MDTEHLKSRIESETRLPDILEYGFSVDLVEESKSGSSKNPNGSGIVVVHPNDNGREMQAKMEEMIQQRGQDARDDMDVVRVEYKIDDSMSNRSFISDNVTEEIESLVYIREAFDKSLIEDTEESKTYEEYHLVDPNWIEG